MNERIKKLRQTLGLTQSEFAERIGSVQNTITGYETGKRMPSNQVVALVCREFHVREEWLRTGEGEMFAPAPSSALDDLAAEHNLTHGEYILIEKFVPASAPAFPSMSPDELHAELDRQIGIEKEAEDEFGA